MGQRLKSMKTRSVMVVSGGGGDAAADDGGGRRVRESGAERRRERRVKCVMDFGFGWWLFLCHLEDK